MEREREPILIGPFAGQVKEIVVHLGKEEYPESQKDDPVVAPVWIGKAPVFGLVYTGELDRDEKPDKMNVLREIATQAILYAEYVTPVQSDQLSEITLRHRQHIDECGGLEAWRMRLIENVRGRIPDFAL